MIFFEEIYVMLCYVMLNWGFVFGLGVGNVVDKVVIVLDKFFEIL